MAKPMTWTGQLLGLLVLCSLAAVPAAATEVALFVNAAYVDYRPGISGAEASNLEDELQDLGYTVTTFSGISAADFEAATAGKAALVLPELENGALGEDLTNAAETAIRSYVEDGGVLVMFRALSDRGVAMLNPLFGYSLATGSCAGVPGTTNYSGALHQGASSETTTLDATCQFSNPPAGAQGLHAMGQYGAVSISEGDGFVVLLGWDWYLAGISDLAEIQGHQVWRGLLDHAIRLGVEERKPATPTTEPAATLLIPYFKIDLDNPLGFTTLFSINNAAAGARLTSITLWTDWGVPTLTFHLYLTGFDIQTINLRSIFAGSLPVTGSGVVASGPLSDPNVDFTACSTSDVSGQILDSLRRSQLIALHSGDPVPPAGLCGGSPQPEGIVSGYVTVDVVEECDVTLNPSTAGYFGAGGIASMDNVLYGDVFYVDGTENFAQGFEAVHIRADEAAYAPGDYTFYGRYVAGDASDARQPLGGTYLVRYFSGGLFTGGTTLYVWRDNKSAVTSQISCGTVPSWAPLAEEPTLVFDEDEDAVSFSSANRYPFLTQGVKIPGLVLDPPFPFGMMVLDLNHDYGVLFDDRAQAWVTVVLDASGLYSVGFPAMMVEDAFGVP